MPGDKADVPYEQYAHEITHAEWMQLMIHFYRGEMHRASLWRQRLDVTTNWAVATTAAMLTFTLGNGQVPHGAIILSVLVTLIMLHLEARRYMYYDLWRARLRMIERGLIAPALWRGSAERELEHESDWRRLLADDLREPRFHMPYSEAFGRRLQRNYIWLLVLNYCGWLLKLALAPEKAHSLSEAVGHAAAGPLPGATVLAIVTIGLVFLMVLGRVTTRHRHARGEARPYQPPTDTERWGIV